MEKLLREKLMNGQFNNVSPLRSKMMQAVKGKGNKTTEVKFCLALEHAGLMGWENHPKLVGNPDICFPIYKVVIFLDGCFWHGCPDCGHIPKTNNAYWKAKLERNIERDIEKTRALEEQGYIVVRFWEHELFKELENCVVTTRNCIEEHLDRLLFLESMKQLNE